jgi:hypothetical protein
MKRADSLRCGFFRTVVKLAQDSTLPLEAVGAQLIPFIAAKLHREFYYALLLLGNATEESGGFDAKFLNLSAAPHESAPSGRFLLA